MGINKQPLINKTMSNTNTDSFIWTDELVIEYSQQWARDRKIPSLAVELFKQSKQPVEDKPKEGLATYEDGFKAGVYWCQKYGIPDVSPPTLERQDSKEAVFDKEKINKQIDRLHYLQALACDLISRIYYYGNFRAETANERALEKILNELQLFPTTEDDILKRPPLIEPKEEPKPLFVTEDGVELFNVTDNCYWVDIKDFRVGRQAIVHKYMCTHKDFKYFSTKAAALEYILMNKPCLSVNDVLNICMKMAGDENFSKMLIDKKELTELANNKINK